MVKGRVGKVLGRIDPTTDHRPRRGVDRRPPPLSLHHLTWGWRGGGAMSSNTAVSLLSVPLSPKVGRSLVVPMLLIWFLCFSLE